MPGWGKKEDSHRVTAPILTKPLLGSVKEVLESDHNKKSCSEIIPLMVFPQMSTTEATRDQPHLWSLDKYTSQTLPFSPPPIKLFTHSHLLQLF